MARILIGTVPVVGHINPFLPLVRSLVARGHEVRWYTGAKYRTRIEAAGASYFPMIKARDYDDSDINGAFPSREAYTGLAQLKFDLKHLFMDNGVGQLRDLEAITRTYRADLLLTDSSFVGGVLLHELSGIPLAVLNVVPMSLSSKDCAPLGLGLAPDASPLGRLRNRALQWAFEHALFGDVQRYWQATRAQVGLAGGGWLMDAPATSSLYLQPSVPGFEYPRSDLPGHVHYIGLLPVDMPPAWQPPAWWGELEGGRPVVHVSQGTIANVAPTLIKPALEGLAEEDVLVVVATGGRSAEELGLGTLPPNARVGAFLAYPELLPRTAAMVTNGGYGGTQLALAAGVPLAVGGTTEDKPEVAARVAWCGAGINLRTAAPLPKQVREAVRALLTDGRYRERAQALRAEYRRYNAVARATSLIEQLASTGRPVLRPGAEMSRVPAAAAAQGD